MSVEGDPFQKVTIHEEPQLREGNRFTVTVDVEASGLSDAGLEYRAVTPDKSALGAWKPAAAGDNTVKCELTSPDIRIGPPETDYHLLLEARKRDQQVVARYPLTFNLRITPQIRQQNAPGK